MPSSRVGPYSAMGTGYYGGIIDYLNYVNIKQGGVNGVKLTCDECETEYNAARTVECYQRLLQQGRAEDGGVRHARHAGRLCRDRPHGSRTTSCWRSSATAAPTPPTVASGRGCSAPQQLLVADRDEDELHRAEGRRRRQDEGQDDRHLHIDTAYGREPLPAMRHIAKDWNVQAGRDRDTAAGSGAAVAVAANPPREGRLGRRSGAPAPA